MSDQSDDQREPGVDSVWKMLCDLGEDEKHFNQLEAQYRTLASTWLLAAFGAMGFLLSTDLKITYLPNEVAILGIALAASIGLLLLWVMDLLVYHRLLDACFVEAMRLENENPSLPQVRRNMVASQPGGEVSIRVMWFWIGVINAPLLFGGALFCYWCLRQFGWTEAAVAAVLVGGVIVALAGLVWTKSPSLASNTVGPIRSRE